MNEDVLPLSVLFVEDETFVREYIGKYLEKHVTSHYLAENGVEGLKIFGKKRIDLVITDITMPKMNGLEMLRQIKAIDANIKTIVITAVHDENFFMQAIDIGVDKFLIKPINLFKLEELLVDLYKLIQMGKELDQQRKILNEYKKAVDAGDIVAIIDKNGIITYVNSKFCEVSGFVKDEIIGQIHTAVYNDNLSKAMERELWETIMGKRIWKGVIENRRKNGENYFVDATIVPILDTQNSIIEFLGIYHDITNLKMMGERNLQAIFDTDDALIIATDETFEVKIVNRAMSHVLGITGTDKDIGIFKRFIEANGFIGPNMIDGDTQSQKLKSLKRLLGSEKTQQKALLRTFCNDEERVYAVHVHTVEDRIVKVKHYNIFSFVDITELEKMRSDQINNIKLTSIGKLAAGITHEINTPLTYIKGYLEMLMDDIERGCTCEIEFKNDCLETCNNIDDGVKRIANIVESMREIAKASQDKKTHCNLFTTLIYSMRMIFNRAKQISNIYINDQLFTLLIDKDMLEFWVTAEAQRLEQVWIILLNNSLDEFSKSLTPFDQRYIKVEITNIDDTIKILFRDNAGGIPEDMIHNIFDLFTSSKAQKGMGIGLNIAKSIIENNGGHIRAFNDAFGAVFEITLEKGAEG